MAMNGKGMIGLVGMMMPRGREEKDGDRSEGSIAAFPQ